MSFQLPTTTTATSSSFSFGLGTTATATKPQSFTFGATGGGDAGTVKPLTFGGASATTAASMPASAGFGSSFQSVTTTTASSVATPAAATTAPTGFSFGAPAAAAAAPNTTAVTATSTAGFGFGAPAAAATAPSTGFNFGATPTASVAVTPATTVTTTAASTVAAPAFPLTTTKTTAPALPPLGTISATVASSTAGFANLNTVTKTTDSASVANASQLSYNQLEEHINKWTLELEEQEKVFGDQATQINAWDKILINNNHKILELNDAVQKVKSDQQTLEQELEFIATQHKELEESILPLQKEFLKLPQVDVERSQTYLLVENLDTQLKQMSEDLKEIIDNLNETNKGQDNTDPIIQIGKILNAHMSSLQWIESSTTNISNKLDDITKMHESFKRESERSFRSAYYN